MTDPLDDDMTELYDAVVPRVDLVGKAANGVPGFLLMKQDATGLLDADTVRELIGKTADTAPASAVRDDITMSGSPAAMAKMIHQAAQRAVTVNPENEWSRANRNSAEASQRLASTVRDLTKAELSSKSTNDLPDGAFAYIEPGGTKDEDGRTTPRSLRHFPIQDEAHVRNALSRAPQSPFGDKALPKIKAAAKKFGIDVSKENPVADPDLEMADLIGDATTGGTAETVPGSPDWENLDGDTAMNALAVLGRVKAVIGWLADREATEAVTSDPSDASDVWSLQDAACALDCAIDTLASFAAGEKLEADMASELEAVGKAAESAVEPLTALEPYGPLVKAGRVLSTANEASIRDAVEKLQKVLASLPPVPTPDDGMSVAKETNMTETPDETVADEVAKTTTDEAVAKAKGDPLIIAYDENGKAIGLVDPDKLMPIAGADDTKTDDAAAPDPDAPAPAPEVGQPADAPAPAVAPVAAPAAAPAVQKNADEPAPTDSTEDDVVKKSQVDELVKAAIEEVESAHAVLVKSLEDRIVTLEKSPAPSGVLRRGALPPAHLMRGQDEGSGGDYDPNAVASLRKAATSGDGSAADREDAARALNAAASAELARLHNQRRQ